jgi:hypothetical protein
MFSLTMATAVQIVLEFIIESTCVLHQMQGLFNFLLSWSCGRCNGNMQMEFLGTQENIMLIFFHFL